VEGLNKKSLEGQGRKKRVGRRDGKNPDRTGETFEFLISGHALTEGKARIPACEVNMLF